MDNFLIYTQGYTQENFGSITWLESKRIKKISKNIRYLSIDQHVAKKILSAFYENNMKAKIVIGYNSIYEPEDDKWIEWIEYKGNVVSSNLDIIKKYVPVFEIHLVDEISPKTNRQNSNVAYS